jgi:hypothetical protein
MLARAGWIEETCGNALMQLELIELAENSRLPDGKG